ncbi:MAG: TetR/AcrR family transcriptional regulator [Polyangiaceae bacterium]|nr:TetR/AcrR family transcriptional regulator [Polyangiaceae bacterium]MBK8939374.1 TetR/AcrR family transcriptional regulator [Polyangiaceae bacterium]
MPKLRDPEARALERRAQILSEAVKVFGDKGFHGASIADIAKRTGLGHGTFYRYFKNKLDIFDAVIGTITEAIRAMVVDEGATESHTLDAYRAQLERIGQRFFSIFEEHEALARLVFREGLTVDAAIGRKVRDVMELFVEMTRAYLENGRQRGFLRGDLDTEITARAINAMIFEGIEQVSNSRSPRVLGERWRKAVIRLMLDGMRAAPPSPSA